jgi:hypothetical protein
MCDRSESPPIDPGGPGGDPLANQLPDSPDAAAYAEFREEHQRRVQSLRDAEEKRRSDLMPNPSTVAGLARLVWDIEKIHRAAGAPPGEWAASYHTDEQQRLLRRVVAMEAAPGFAAFKTYLNSELGMDVIPEAMKEISRRLARGLMA